MNVKLLLQQLQGIREHVNIPLILMGYFNPILQYGVEQFCKEVQQIGIDGLIIPDMPVDVYEKQYMALFKKQGLHHVLLVSPSTSDERIKYIDKLSSGFLYAVASSSTTGSSVADHQTQNQYLERLKISNCTIR